MARSYLAGGLHLDVPTAAFGDPDLPGNQGRIAFAALAVERRPISHDALADIVWDQSPPEQWKSALSAVISKVRSLITKTGLDGASTLSSAGGAYELHPPSDLWVDLEDAFRRLDRGGGGCAVGKVP